MVHEPQSVTIDQLCERLEALDRLTDAKFVTISQLIEIEADKVELALQAAEKAIDKAETATEKRFDCVASDTPVLCADLTWRPAGALMVGDELIAFEEEISRRHGRVFRRAIVTANSLETDELWEITTAVGSVRCNANHPWLCRPGTNALNNAAWRWVETRNLAVQDVVHHPMDVWERDASWEGGWLAGMFDGEGCLSLRRDGGVAQLSITQRVSPTSERIGHALARILGHEAPSFVFQPGSPSAPMNTVPVVHFIVSRRPDVLKLLGSVRPSRLLVNSDAVWDGKTMGGRARRCEVESVTKVGRGEIAMLSTSTGTFIANGFAMHNSVNEFRDALSDQTRTFVTRDVFDQVFSTSQSDRAALHRTIEELRLALTDLVPRSEARTTILATEKVLDNMRSSIDSVRQGQTRMVGIAVGLSAAITIISTLTALVVRLAGN